MNPPYRPLALGVLAIAFSVLLFERAQAGGSHYFAPVSDPVVKEECGGCHLAYAPSMLPASSWKRMLGDLRNHFGDDVSVNAKTAAHISNYLVANAGDTGGQRYSEKLLRGVSTSDAPLRISELPRWVKEHRKVSNREWKDVRTRANCVACHQAAERGYYEE